MDTHNLICDFGRHKGQPYTRLPVSYLTWMVGSRHSRAEIAEAELKRRGTTTPDLELSGHAVNRVSLHSLHVWKETRKEDEGLYSWLHRVAREALDKNDRDPKGRYRHLGLRFAIDTDGVWPVVKTVIPGRKGHVC